MTKRRTTAKITTTAAKPKRTAKPAAVVSRAGAPRRVSARWDAAQSNPENRKHWAMADGLSADAAAAPQVRRVLRNRSRYERDNNTYAEGLVTTLANDCVGTGPRLQLTGLPEDLARLVESEFAAWAATIDLGEKLRTMRAARAVDGEGFGLLTSNDALEHPVKLDLRLIEAEQVASTDLVLTSRNVVDGIHFDQAGNVLWYDVLSEHPGNGFGNIGGFGAFLKSTQISPAAVLHFFVPKRPGQRRGIPELTPALPLFAQLRRWTLSVLAAAETASDFAALLYTEQPPDGETSPADPFESLEIERRMMMTVPAGWKMEQFKAEQPISTYGEFKREIIGEIARCLQVPFNIAAGNSSNYNYSSGRLDHQIYHKALRVDRARMQVQVLDRLFAAWRNEAILIEGYLPQALRTTRTDWSHGWFWDGSEHVDPEKEANAQATRLASLTTTLAAEYGKAGADWNEQLAQIARERKKMAELGIQLPAAPAGPGRPPSPDGAPADDNGATDGGGADSGDTENAPAPDTAEATRFIRNDDGTLATIERTRTTRRPAKARR